MAKNEAKIKFTAETGEFNKAIKQANDEMSNLRAELKLNETQMKSTGASVEALEAKHGLLEKQLKASENKTEALAQKVQKAAEIYGENSSEVTKLKTQLANAQSAEEKIRQAIASCNSEIEKQTRTEKEAASETAKLTSKISEQKNELERLKKEHAEAVLKYGATSKEAKTLGKDIEKLSTELKGNEEKLEGATKGADKFDKSIDDVGDSSVDLGGKLGKLAVGVAAVGAAMVAAGKEAIEAFNEVDDGADNVIKATGATGEAAAELETAYKNVASSIVGDFGDIGSTLGEVNTRFGFTGSEAEEATTQFLKFSEVTGMDAVTAVQDVSRAIESAGLDTSDYKSILDSLTKAGQHTGVSVDTLASSLTDNGAVMREMGYDTNTTIAMLAQFEKAGVDSNSVVRGMRTAIAKWSKDGLDAKDEFSKLVNGIKDGSVSAGEAYEVFGSKAGGELVDAIKSGRFEYEDMLAVIEGSKGSLDSTFDSTIDGGYELELAMQNGKMALAEAGEELGTALIPAFKAFSGNVLPAATKAISAMVAGVSSAVGWMTEHKGVMIAVASVIGVLVTAIGAYNIVQGVKSAMDAAQVTTVWALVSAHWAQATAAMAALAPYLLIVAAIAAVIAIVIVCIKYWDEIVAAVKNAMTAVVSAIQKAFGWIKDNWQGLLLFLVNPVAGVFKLLYDNCDGFRAKVDSVVSAVKEFFVNLWNNIVSGCQAAWTWVKGVFSSFTAWVNTNLIQPVVNFFTDLWRAIQNIWQNICNAVQVAIMFIGSIISAAFQIITLPFRFIWENCKNYVISAFNTIKNFISNALSAIGNWFSNLWVKIRSIFAPIAGWFSQKFNAAKQGVLNAWSSVSAWFSNLWSSIKNIFSAVGSWFSQKFSAAKQGVLNAWSSVSAWFSNLWSGIKNIFASVGSWFSQKFSAAKQGVLNAWSSVKQWFSNLWSNIKNIFSNVGSWFSQKFNAAKEAIIKPINAAKNAVKSALDSIKGFFSGLKLKFPNIKLPHFKITGSFSLNPPSVPKLGIEWYAKAMNNPMILNSPTIFGAAGGKLLGGGEVGSEMIGGTNTIMQMIQSAVDKSMRANDIGALTAAVAKLADRPIELSVNGRRFAVATASDSDSVNGLRNELLSRGLILD